jgi:hypothetical protein
MPDKLTGVKAMSVYRADLLDELGVEYEAIIESHPDHLIVSITARQVRDLELGVVPVPEHGPIGQAHAHVTGKKTGGRRSRLADAAEWVKGPQSHSGPAT